MLVFGNLTTEEMVLCSQEGEAYRDSGTVDRRVFYMV